MSKSSLLPRMSDLPFSFPFSAERRLDSEASGLGNSVINYPHFHRKYNCLDRDTPCNARKSFRCKLFNVIIFKCLIFRKLLRLVCKSLSLDTEHSWGFSIGDWFHILSVSGFFCIYVYLVVVLQITRTSWLCSVIDWRPGWADICITTGQ